MSNFQLPVLSQDASLVKYLEEIKKFPMLSEQEEVDLAWRWHKNGDIEAAQKLVTSHLRLVAKIAMQYRGYGLPVVDMISEGNLGLMTAVKKFNPGLGHRLATYAIWWIKANIQDYILKSWSLLKVGTSATHKKLFFNLKKIKSKILNANNGFVPANETELIAKELDVSKDEVIEMTNRFYHDSSLNDNTYRNDVSGGEVIDSIAEPSDNQEESLIKRNYYDYKKSKFKKALTVLNDRERDILFARRMSEEPVKLEELSKRYSISKERVRQIEDKAFKKVQAAALAGSA